MAKANRVLRSGVLPGRVGACGGDVQVVQAVDLMDRARWHLIRWTVLVWCCRGGPRAAVVWMVFKEHSMFGLRGPGRVGLDGQAAQAHRSGRSALRSWCWPVATEGSAVAAQVRIPGGRTKGWEQGRPAVLYRQPGGGVEFRTAHARVAPVGAGSDPSPRGALDASSSAEPGPRPQRGCVVRVVRIGYRCCAFGSTGRACNHPLRTTASSPASRLDCVGVSGLLAAPARWPGYATAPLAAWSWASSFRSSCSRSRARLMNFSAQAMQ